jgi:hypothetical protein
MLLITVSITSDGGAAPVALPLRQRSRMTKKNLKGIFPESWNCINCGRHTAPGMPNRSEMAKALAATEAAGEEGVDLSIDDRAELYGVRNKVWKAAGMKPKGGCLCIGCLEKRLGRKLPNLTKTHGMFFQSEMLKAVSGSSPSDGEARRGLPPSRNQQAQAKIPLSLRSVGLVKDTVGC